VTAAAQRTMTYDYRSSTAPDITVMPGRTAQPHVVKRTAAQLRAEEARATRKAMRILAATTVLLTLIGFLVYSQVRLDELTRQLTDIQNKTTVVQSDNTRLESELSSKISLDKVEDYAENTLGMVKVENYQIQYVDLSGQDKVVVSGNKTYAKTSSAASGLKAKLKSLF
jgi:cell division protein FtsL